MNKLKYTEGPWNKCHANDNKCPCGLIWDKSGNFVIASVTSTCKEHESSNLQEGIQRGSEEYLANAQLIACAPDFVEDKIKDFYEIGKWFSAALSDPNVCKEMKEDVENWFKRFDTFEKATGIKIKELK